MAKAKQRPISTAQVSRQINNSSREPYSSISYDAVRFPDNIPRGHFFVGYHQILLLKNSLSLVAQAPRLC